MSDTPKQAQMDADWVVRGLNDRPVTAELINTVDNSRRTGPFKCVKGMTHTTCPYNPLLGCDCGYNKPRRIRGEGHQ